MAYQSARGQGKLTRAGSAASQSGRDTIAAVATPPGQGAIAIVRLSGPAALRIAETLTGRTARPRRAELRSFRDADGREIDRGLVLFFPGPDSYTGEDVVELHGHGGPVIVDWLLERVLSAGARAARPGEFTLRAFLNDKIDLTQAEAVAALIESGSRQAAQAALRSLTGAFAESVAALQRALTEVRAIAEAWLDFPEEDIDPSSLAELSERLAQSLSALDALIGRASQGAALLEGFSIAIAGPPNAGKSSLLNRLAHREVAIVTDIPGTTRDAVRDRLDVGGLPVEVVDTAGLRSTADPIEQEGVRRALDEVRRADHVLWVAELGAARESASGDREGDLGASRAATLGAGYEAALAAARAEIGAAVPFTVVLNKVDLTSEAPARLAVDGVTMIRLSALTGAGMELLTAHIRELAGLTEDHVGTLGARRRHLDALERARGHLDAAWPHLPGALELCAEELRAAQRYLSELTGEVTSEELLGEIFASFCIGK